LFTCKLSFDVGSWEMSETHAYGRRRDRFGSDEAPTLVAPTLREAELSALLVQRAEAPVEAVALR